jgi:large subunit ribosomal protein L29|tara:strand:- start:304 stop:501 length:198 start_codon:yes stop_codon:yes gene_type:complete
MKQPEIEKLSLEDIIDKLQEFKKKLNELKMSHTVSPLENPIQIRDMRRTISRLSTALNLNQKSNK